MEAEEEERERSLNLPSRLQRETYRPRAIVRAPIDRANLDMAAIAENTLNAIDG